MFSIKIRKIAKKYEFKEILGSFGADNSPHHCRIWSKKKNSILRKELMYLCAFQKSIFVSILLSVSAENATSKGSGRFRRFLFEGWLGGLPPPTLSSSNPAYPWCKILSSTILPYNNVQHYRPFSRYQRKISAKRPIPRKMEIFWLFVRPIWGLPRAMGKITSHFSEVKFCELSDWLFEILL